MVLLRQVEKDNLPKSVPNPENTPVTLPKIETRPTLMTSGATITARKACTLTMSLATPQMLSIGLLWEKIPVEWPIKSNGLAGRELLMHTVALGIHSSVILVSKLRTSNKAGSATAGSCQLRPLSQKSQDALREFSSTMTTRSTNMVSTV